MTVGKFNPHNTRIGQVFWWPGVGMFRRGRGIFYRARPYVKGIVAEQAQRRRNRRQSKLVKSFC